MFEITEVREHEGKFCLYFRDETINTFQLYYNHPHLRKIDPDERRFPCTPNDNCFICGKDNELYWGCTGCGYFCPGGYGDSIYTFCYDCKRGIDKKLEVQ